MVDTLAESDPNIDANLATLSKFGRYWLLPVAALDVLLVISSMVALNAAPSGGGRPQTMNSAAR